MEVYLLKLHNHKDEIFKVIDEETKSWIYSRNLGREKGESGWYDKTVPEAVRKRTWEEHTNNIYVSDKIRYDEFYPYLTIGSWENDRMLWVAGLFADGEELSGYNGVVKFVKEIESKGFNIVGELSGLIY